jgi:hypothetical protein
MFVLSGLAKFLRNASLVALILPTILAGCASDDGPTSAEAGQVLKSHVLQLLKERNAQNVTVMDQGGKNIPCADGLFKQTFAATGVDVAKETDSGNIRAALLGALGRVASYVVVDAGSLSNPVMVKNSSTRTRLVLDSPSKGVYQITGETDCLAS